MGFMQALSSYNPERDSAVSVALRALEERHRAQGLTARSYFSPKGVFSRFVWPDLPLETSSRLGTEITALHKEHPELGLEPVQQESHEWNAVFHGWRSDLESAAAIEKAFSIYFPERVLWVESERDTRGRIAAECRIKDLVRFEPFTASPLKVLGTPSAAESEVVALELFWRDSLLLTPRGRPSDSDMNSLRAATQEVWKWAERRIQVILDALQERLRALYGERFKGLYVFGSYARPDAGIKLPEDSDLDVALILSDFENVYDERARFGDITYDLELEHGLAISVIPIREADFREGRTNFTRVISEYAIRV
ncbi:MAG: hypothetical protein DMG27_02685 [Acidobacteria bacterium]|nr:MAG: hypothetical protein DMG27_02685 [Acidobacteriota bacterium]